eukprot:1187461-Prorocentrum_minimum.AAC.1
MLVTNVVNIQDSQERASCATYWHQGIRDEYYGQGRGTKLPENRPWRPRPRRPELEGLLPSDWIGQNGQVANLPELQVRCRRKLRCVRSINPSPGGGDKGRT